MKQGQEVERFEKDGLRFKDGSFLPADIVVLATGASCPALQLGSIG